jgi:hypothetical protein
VPASWCTVPTVDTVLCRLITGICDAASASAVAVDGQSTAAAVRRTQGHDSGKGDGFSCLRRGSRKTASWPVGPISGARGVSQELRSSDSPAVTAYCAVPLLDKGHIHQGHFRPPAHATPANDAVRRADHGADRGESTGGRTVQSVLSGHLTPWMKRSLRWVVQRLGGQWSWPGKCLGRRGLSWTAVGHRAAARPGERRVVRSPRTD